MQQRYEIRKITYIYVYLFTVLQYYTTENNKHEMMENNKIHFSNRNDIEEKDKKSEYSIPNEKIQFSNINDIYLNKTALAPMVRVNTLPFRLLSREQGCSLLYSEEIIAKKLKKCERRINIDGTIQIIDTNNSNKLILHTYKNEPLIIQLGVSDGIDAIQATEIIANDCIGIDINMGCPKLFSLQGKMGSALLYEPEKVHDIITSLKRNYNLPISCKIRMLSNTSSTMNLIRAIEHMGVNSIAIHARYKDDRSSYTALPYQQLPDIISSTVRVPIQYNGDVFSIDDIYTYRYVSKSPSIMIARGALWNPSIFSISWDIISKFLYKSIDTIYDIPINFPILKSLPSVTQDSFQKQFSPITFLDKWDTKSILQKYLFTNQYKRDSIEYTNTTMLPIIYNIHRLLYHSKNLQYNISIVRYIFMEMLKYNSLISGSILSSINGIKNYNELEDIIASIESLLSKEYSVPFPMKKFKSRDCLRSCTASHNKSTKKRKEISILNSLDCKNDIISNQWRDLCYRPIL